MTLGILDIKKNLITLGTSSNILGGPFNVTKMITLQQNTYNWKFIFLGVDITSIKEAQGWGIASSHMSTYKKVNTQCVYDNISQNVSMLRSGTKLDCSFDDTQVKAMN